MNAEAIQKKLEEYYSKATPEQVLKEFEALGVEFVIIPEIQHIQFGFEVKSPFEFNNDFQSWANDFLVKSPEKDSFAFPPVIPTKTVAAAPQNDVHQQLAGNSQYAMAA